MLNLNKYFNCKFPMIYPFRTNDNVFYECLKYENKDNINLFEEKIIYNLKSLDKLDKNIYLSEAEIKTYPTNIFNKRLIKIISDKYSDKNIIFGPTVNENPYKMHFLIKQTSSEITDKTSIDTEKYNVLNSILIRANYDCIENDIAGYASYHISINEDYDDLLLEIMKLCKSLRYDFVSYLETNFNGINGLQFAIEAKFQSNNIKISDKLYHISPESLKDKILKYGLQPKSDSVNKFGRKINHSDRVYLFNRYSENLFKSFVRQIQKQSKRFNNNFKLLINSKSFCIFEIDKNEIEDLKLYRDNIFKSTDISNPIAVYTYSNIKPSAIEFVGKIQI